MSPQEDDTHTGRLDDHPDDDDDDLVKTKKDSTTKSVRRRWIALALTLAVALVGIGLVLVFTIGRSSSSSSSSSSSQKEEEIPADPCDDFPDVKSDTINLTFADTSPEILWEDSTTLQDIFMEEYNKASGGCGGEWERLVVQVEMIEVYYPEPRDKAVATLEATLQCRNCLEHEALFSLPETSGDAQGGISHCEVPSTFAHQMEQRLLSLKVGKIVRIASQGSVDCIVVDSLPANYSTTPTTRPSLSPTTHQIETESVPIFYPSSERPTDVPSSSKVPNLNTSYPSPTAGQVPTSYPTLEYPVAATVSSQVPSLNTTSTTEITTQLEPPSPTEHATPGQLLANATGIPTGPNFTSISESPATLAIAEVSTHHVTSNSTLRNETRTMPTPSPVTPSFTTQLGSYATTNDAPSRITPNSTEPANAVDLVPSVAPLRASAVPLQLGPTESTPTEVPGTSSGSNNLGKVQTSSSPTLNPTLLSSGTSVTTPSPGTPVASPAVSSMPSTSSELQSSPNVGTPAPPSRVPTITQAAPTPAAPIFTSKPTPLVSKTTVAPVSTNPTISGATFAPVVLPATSLPVTPTPPPANVVGATLVPVVVPTPSPPVTPTLPPIAPPTTARPTIRNDIAEPTSPRPATQRPSPNPTPKITPSKVSTVVPTSEPSVKPSPSPTLKPTAQPSTAPTKPPTRNPTARPTAAPTKSPTEQPTLAPTTRPTPQPTDSPTMHPTPVPTRRPTKNPTLRPTAAPTRKPTAYPTFVPTLVPTPHPTFLPTPMPTNGVVFVIPTAVLGGPCPGICPSGGETLASYLHIQEIGVKTPYVTDCVDLDAEMKAAFLCDEIPNKLMAATITNPIGQTIPYAQLPDWCRCPPPPIF